MRGVAMLLAALVAGMLVVMTGPTAPSAWAADLPVPEERADDRSSEEREKTYEVVGRGYGHGRGMSQYGAYAAATAGNGYRRILDFYYPGTDLVTRKHPKRVRVLLTHDGSPIRVRTEPGLQVWWTHPDGATRFEHLPAEIAGSNVEAWKVQRTSGEGMRVRGYSSGDWHTLVPDSAILDGGRVSFVPADSTLRLRLWPDDASSPIRRSYRGAMRIVIADGELRPINLIGYNDYLRSVVPSESYASWPEKTLRAQAIAARSYASRSAYDSRDSYFDVYDTTASQAYPGKAAYDADWNRIDSYEYARTTEAVEATSRRLLKYDGKPAFTEFGASNGGRTATGDYPYLRSRKDKWDRAADPYRKWTAEISAKSLEAGYPSLGKLTDIRIVERSGEGKWDGRVREIELVGKHDTVTISGEDDVRIALGLRSAWFRLR